MTPYKRRMKVTLQSHFLDEIERLCFKGKIKEFFPALSCEVAASTRKDVRDGEDVMEGIRQLRRELAAGK